MTDFADVEEFVRQHAGCGGLTPSATVQPAGGFLLTLTCVCRQTFDRRVTAAEAKQPLPPLSAPRRATPDAPPVPPAASEPVASPRRPRQALDRPRATPSRESVEALRAALEAEPDPETGARGLAADKTAPTSAAGNTSRVAPTLPGGMAPRPRRPPVARLDLDGTIRKALERRRADVGEQRKSEESAPPRRVWRWLLVVAVLGLVGWAAYRYLNIVTHAPIEKSRGVPTGSRLTPEPPAALEAVVRSLRQLGGAGSGPDDRSCPDVRTALDRASQVESVTLEQARSAALSAAVPKLWECARARLAGLERLLAEQR
jgi:hypothetical protein